VSTNYRDTTFLKDMKDEDGHSKDTGEIQEAEQQSSPPERSLWDHRVDENSGKHSQDLKRVNYQSSLWHCDIERTGAFRLASSQPNDNRREQSAQQYASDGESRDGAPVHYKPPNG
jgi:hypothetical protein